VAGCERSQRKVSKSTLRCQQVNNNMCNHACPTKL
jgi:hypothetical protein